MSISKRDLITHKPDMAKVDALGFFVIVLPDQIDTTKAKSELEVRAQAAGLQLPEELVQDEEWKERQKTLMQTSGIIVAVGNTCWKAFDDGKAWARKGNRVFYRRYEGLDFIALDGKTYKVLKDTDIMFRERL